MFKLTMIFFSSFSSIDLKKKKIEIWTFFEFFFIAKPLAPRNDSVKEKLAAINPLQTAPLHNDIACWVRFLLCYLLYTIQIKSLYVLCAHNNTSIYCLYLLPESHLCATNRAAA
jgi:hypothetical protein